tara:strand:+ start:332 stop:619 length:288 start_codon:yes stop_codon:yes gene_type:complete
MNRYYCPYCNPKYQFQKESREGYLLCGLCGEELIKKPLIDLKKIVALLLATAFILPLLYLISFLILNNFERKERKYQARQYLSFDIKKVDLSRDH